MRGEPTTIGTSDLTRIHYTIRMLPLAWQTDRFIRTASCEVMRWNNVWNRKIHGWFHSHFLLRKGIKSALIKSVISTSKTKATVIRVELTTTHSHTEGIDTFLLTRLTANFTKSVFYLDKAECGSNDKIATAEVLLPDTTYSWHTVVTFIVTISVQLNIVCFTVYIMCLSGLLSAT